MPIRTPTKYPFVPQTTVRLVPGQFWALPLSDGTFGCGRVIEVDPASQVLFLAAVLDWHGELAPSAEFISGSKCLRQGRAHLKCITETGGAVLGHRNLALDGIESWEFRGAEFHLNSQVYRGLHPVRPQRESDRSLPILSTWGFKMPLIIAEAEFVTRKPIVE